MKPRKQSTPRRPPSELTPSNLRAAIRELLQVALLWESGYLEDGLECAEDHHARRLEDFVVNMDRHWHETPVGQAGNTTIRLGDPNAIALRERVVEILGIYQTIEKH
ncbi:MAG: hypothetical protein GY811_22685, partial [Myxococcales bacterium]|nr:hypothetical protein [Myxococcales bacterium]